MHFSFRRPILACAWCLCLAAFHVSAQEPADEVFITDQPAETAAASSPPTAPSRSARPAKMQAPPYSSEEPRPLPAEGEPFEFDGIQPGESSAADVRNLWGEPQTTQERAGETVHVYSRKPFKQVEVTVSGEKVLSIVVALNERFAAADVARQLELMEFEPVLQFDGAELCLGQAYPERGVVLRWATIGKAPEDAGKHEVAEVAFGRIEASHFLLRAEARFDSQDSGALADLNRALQQEPNSPQALGLKARLLWRVGRRREASDAIVGALQADPQNPEYRLLHARLLAEEGDQERALAETTQVVSLGNASAVTQALGLVQLGELTAAGPEPDYHQLIESYQQAIKLAESMLGDSHASVRRKAGEALVDAHLGIANAIAWGRWKMKAMAVEKWLERAEVVAQESLASDQLDAHGELRVCQAALAACVGAQGLVDPAAWAERAMVAGQRQMAQARDPLCRQRLNWQIGLTLHDALQTFQVRQEFEPALKYGIAAADCLDQAARGRQLTAADAYMLGRLYYRLGSLYAMRLDQHQTAVAWYEKAFPLLERQTAAEAKLSQHGESLVTAAISYWNENQRDKAVSLTSRGIKLLEQAAGRGEIGKRSLSIPYANLAAMHEQLGDRVQAASYAEQASNLDADAEAVAGK